MPLKKLLLAPGINQENTRYTNENGWWTGDKVRFRQGTPEKIGGWQRVSSETYQGICRSMFTWVSLVGQQYISVGTNLKYYLENGGVYYNITPFRATTTPTDPFATTNTSAVVTVTDVAHGAITNDTVVFSGATAVGGLTINGSYIVTVIDADTYTITASSPATSTATGGGTVTADYEINIGNALESPTSGWGGGPYGLGPWGQGTQGVAPLRLWSQDSFGEDLLFTYRGGALYTWMPSAVNPLTVRGVLVTTLVGSSDVPSVLNSVLVSDVSRFVLAFGCNEYGGIDLDPLLIRWSDQESMLDWTPSATNQAGSIRLSKGSEIVTRVQMRQEILAFTDTAVYSLQYLGPPIVWGAQLMGDNITIASPNAVATAAGAAYWMGEDKFYVYNGQVQPLVCNVLRYVYDNLNKDQIEQVFAGTVTQFNEVWWFYPTGTSDVPDSYVIYNYVENIWSLGTLTRYAWLDNTFKGFPVAAGEDRLVQHEFGTDNGYDALPEPIHAFIESAEFDIDDGDKFAFVRRVIPDITFRNSTSPSPSATLTLYPMRSSGSGFKDSVGGVRSSNINRTASGVVEEFTEQLNIRVRGRQLVMRIESAQLGTTWQAGAMRLDLRADGGRG